MRRRSGCRVRLPFGSGSPITTRRIRRGSFKSVAELEQAIADYLRTYNERPKPFVWTKPADLILREVQKIAERLAPPENQKRTSDSGH